MASVVVTGVASLIRAMSLLSHKKDNAALRCRTTQNNHFAFKGEKNIPCLPDIVGVPATMDDDLLRADGEGAGFTAVQVVFAQVDSVGVTAARPQRNKCQSSVKLGSISRLMLMHTSTRSFLPLKFSIF